MTTARQRSRATSRRPALTVVALVVFLAACSQAENASGPRAVDLRTFSLDGSGILVASDVAWRDDETILVSGREGIAEISLDGGTHAPVIPGEPLPDGARDVTGVATLEGSLVAYSMPGDDLSGWRVDSGELIFALREPPGYAASDIEMWNGQVALLGWPRSRQGRMDNPAGGGVWIGPMRASWDGYWPLHSLRGTPTQIEDFEWTLWPTGGALAREADGGLAVIVASEPGVYRYGPDGRLREILGPRMDELVGKRLEDVVGLFGGDYVGRYREIINRQPWINDLVATLWGPAVVVHLFDDGVTRWELWYPGEETVRAKIPLPLAIEEEVVWLRAEARGDRLAMVYRSADGPISGPADAGERRSWLSILTLEPPFPDEGGTS